MLRGLFMSTHAHRKPEEKLLESNTKATRLLRTVSYEEGFHFYIAVENFTKETATSLDAFEKKLHIVPGYSINFHLQRGDFQKWMKNVLGDEELVKRVNLINLTLPVEEMRKELLSIVQTRLTELRQDLPHNLSHDHS